MLIPWGIMSAPEATLYQATHDDHGGIDRQSARGRPGPWTRTIPIRRRRQLPVAVAEATTDDQEGPMERASGRSEPFDQGLAHRRGRRRLKVRQCW